MSLVTATYLEGISTLKDGSIKLVFSTQELGAEEAGKVFGLRGKYLKMVLSDENISREVVEEIEKVEVEEKRKNEKSKSQQLRNVLFRLWEQTPNNFDDFEKYYPWKMDQIIEFYKSKLD